MIKIKESMEQIDHPFNDMINEYYQLKNNSVVNDYYQESYSVLDFDIFDTTIFEET